MNNPLASQVGGNHYVCMKIQPIVFIVDAQLSFIQGCIVKYITRYKNKNGKQDIEKCIHYSKLAIELNEAVPELSNICLAYNYCKNNNLEQLQTNIVISAVKADYYNVIRYCNALIKKEYS